MLKFFLLQDNWRDCPDLMTFVVSQENNTFLLTSICGRIKCGLLKFNCIKVSLYLNISFDQVLEESSVQLFFSISIDCKISLLF